MSHPNIRLVDRAKETTTTTGSGTVSLGGAVAGFVAISGVGNGNSTYYTLEEGNNFEVGIGTYTSSGNTLSRDEVYSSSNSNDSKINLSGGATVFITYPAEKAVVETSGGYVGIGGIDPEYQLVVSGTGSFNTVRWADGTTQTTAATDTTYTAGTGLTLVGTEFNTDGTGHFDYLGIGTGAIPPTYPLHVAGNMGVDEYIYHNGDGNTFIRFAPDLINLVAGSWSAIKLEKNTGKVQLNNGNHDLDIQIMADDGEVILHTDAATNNVGIGITTPGYDLEVSGTGSFNTVRWADGTAQITSATGAISTVSGLTVTNATNIAATGASNLSLIRSYIDTSGNATFNNLIAQGNLTVSGTLTYLDSTTVTIADKQLELASNSGTPIGNDSAVNDGGIVVKSTDSDKKWTWLDATDAWTSTENISLNASKKIIFGDGTEQTTSATGDIATVSGLTVTNASNIAATGATNGALIATNTANIATNVTNIASTGATNAAAIAAKDNYQYWTATDGGTTSNVSTTGDVKITGAGLVTVSLASGNPNVFTISGGGGGGGGAPTDAQYVTLATDGDLSAERVLAGGTGVGLADGGANGNITVSITGASTSNTGIAYYSSDNFAVSAGYQVSIKDGGVSNDELGGSIANGKLANDSVTVTAGSGLIHGGEVDLGSSITIDAVAGTTAQSGIVQLQDSATNGTTNRAITPNAVYDISGVLSTTIASTGATNAANIATNTSNISTNTTNIASTGATNAAAIGAVSGLLYDYWTLRGDAATTTNVDSAETVQFSGVGGASVSLGGTDNRVVTISVTDADTTYTAGSGLRLNGTTFDAFTATTSRSGIVQLQDSATNGTTNLAITPNAVYDISGVLSTSIASTGATNAANIATNTSNISTNTSNISTNTTNIASTGATNATAIATKAPKDSQYVTLALDGDLSAERVLVGGTGVKLTDGGANGNVTVHITGASTSNTGIAYYSPDNFAVSAGHQVTIKDGGVSSDELAGSIANSKLANSSITVTAGSGLEGGGSVSLGGTVTLDTAETGWFEKIGINDRTPDAMLDIVSAATGDVGIRIEMAEGSPADPFQIVRSNGVKVSFFDSAGDMNCGAISGSGANYTYGRANISPTFRAATGANNLNIRNPNADKDINFDVHTTAGAITFRDYPNYTRYFSFNMGSDADGTGMYIRSRDDTSILTQWQSTGGTPVAMVDPTGAISGQHFIFGDGTTQSTASAGGAGAPTDAQYVTLATDGDLSAERVLAGGTGIGLADGGANGNITVSITGASTSNTGIAYYSPDNFAVSAGYQVTIKNSGVSNDELAGSIANSKLANSSVNFGGVSLSLGGSDTTPAFNLSDATAYKTTNLDGTITNAQLAGSIANDKLANSTFTVNAGTGLSNGGSVALGASVTVDADTATTSAVGVVQLQDSATNGTVNRAITPNAVYDISGVLQTKIDAGGGGGSPGGSDTQVQFNDSTSFGGDADLTWNKTTNVLTVAGHIAATTKSFLIDHPVKENKKLQYASLEGPENGVYVRGHTTSHVIELPDYWVALVDHESITVHLTPKGKPQPSLCVNRVAANKVYLSSDQHISAYYTVSATRKDVPPLEVEI